MIHETPPSWGTTNVAGRERAIVLPGPGALPVLLRRLPSPPSPAAKKHFAPLPRRPSHPGCLSVWGDVRWDRLIPAHRGGPRGVMLRGGEGRQAASQTHRLEVREQPRSSRNGLRPSGAARVSGNASTQSLSCSRDQTWKSPSVLFCFFFFNSSYRFYTRFYNWL